MGLFGAISGGLSKLGGLAAKLAPAVGLIPGVGTLASAGLRAGGGILSGENVGSALKGAALGAVPGAGISKLTKLARLAGSGKGAVEGGSSFLNFANDFLGGSNTAENVRNLLSEIVVPVGRGVDQVITRGQRNRRSDELDSFFASSRDAGNARIDELRDRQRQGL